MEVTTCSHQEKISSMVDGIETGECSICHQVRRYDRREPKAIVEITRLGRIEGKLVIPNPKEKYHLSAEETAELLEARKDGKPISKPATPTSPESPVGTGREWYQAHKKEMIEDLLTMDIDAFYKKWPIKRQVLSHLKSDILYRKRIAGREATQELKKGEGEPRQKKVKHHSRLKKGRPSIEDVSDALKKAEVDKLPPFPEWAPEKWASSEIAIQWLRTYEALQAMQLVLLLSQNSKTSPAAPTGEAKQGGWFRRLFKQ